MSHDEFEIERCRAEHVMEILEHCAQRLESRAYVPLSVLSDAVAFIRSSEDAAYDAAQMGDENPPLSACVEQHVAAMKQLHGLQDAMAGLQDGDAAAAGRFVWFAREYVRLRREHIRLDDRLFTARRPANVDRRAPIDAVESVGTRQLYDRLIEAAEMLDIGAPTAFPTRSTRRSGAR